MMNQIKTYAMNRNPYTGRQTGALTLFTGTLVLILMTLMLFYATRVSIFEQRVSANDMNQKLAFHAAEAGIDHATEWFFANNMLITSASEDVLSNGADGWMVAGAERWLKCADFTADWNGDTEEELAHPCRGESSATRRTESHFYYYDDPLITGDDPFEVAIDTETFLSPSQAVSMRAVLCVLVVDFDPLTNGGVPVTGCSTDSAVASGEHFMVTFLARGQSDCNNGVCQGEALITEPVSNFSALNGPPPSVPLTTRSTFPPGGTAEIVTSPNSGGIGVPISVWASGNSSCTFGITDAFGNGNWSTCEAHEWYGQDYLPADLRCQFPSCSCNSAEAISNTVGAFDQLGIDMFWDVDFPCDLFLYYFGVPRSAYNIIKSSAQIVSDCASFGPDSTGLYWVSGPSCNFPSNIEIGTLDNPVVIVSAAGQASLNGNTTFWGVLFITDVEDAAAHLDSVGVNYLYGALIVDAPIDNFAGTLKLIYAASSIVRAHGAGNLGALLGGWTDFPECWHKDCDEI